MSVPEAIILGIIQGLTEFLPVSSSGHLTLFQYIMGHGGETPLMFDICLHVSSLFAVIIFFRKKLLSLSKGVFDKKTKKDSFREVFMICISTFVTASMVFFTKPLLMNIRKEPGLLFFTFLFTAVILLAAGYMMKKKNEDRAINVKDAIFIGFFQGLAVLPGISRSGSTIAAGLFRKISREKAVEYSFLLFIPAILGALVLELAGEEWRTMEILPVIAGSTTSFVSSLLALKLLIIMVKKTLMFPFSIYLGILSLTVLIFI
ncbi:MAG: undecaprenyl-diphosphate phosphatase [bacterium]